MKALRYAVATALAVLLGGSLFAGSATAQDFDWRQFEGETIRGILWSAAYTDTYLRPMTEKFEEVTGMTFQMETFNSPQARRRMDTMMAASDGSVDVQMVQMDNRGGKLTAAGNLEPIEKYLNDPSLTPPNFNYPNDWLPGCLNTAKVIDGQPLNNMVWSAQAQLLHVRKDLFAKHGVALPTNMAELEEAARKLTIDENGDGEPEIYGFLARGRGHLITASFGTYLWNHGGSWITRDADGNRVAGINSPEAIDAFEYYGRLMREYAPPSALNNRPADNANLFAAGQTAMLSELNFWISLSENKRKSRIAGKSTTILVPAGPAGSYPNIPTTSFGINPFSEKKEQAWLYIAFMTAPEQLSYAQNHGNPTCRKSAWNDPSYEPPTAAWGKSAQIASYYGYSLAKPQAIAIGEMRSAAGEVMSVAIRDGSRDAIKAEADRQAEIMNQLIRETEEGIDFRGVTREGAPQMPSFVQELPVLYAEKYEMGDF